MNGLLLVPIGNESRFRLRSVFCFPFASRLSNKPVLVTHDINLCEGLCSAGHRTLSSTVNGLASLKTKNSLIICEDKCFGKS